MDDLHNLSPNNFYSICDVAQDIYEKLQMTAKEEVSIPFWKDVTNYPLDILHISPIHQKGAYKEGRRTALNYMMSKGYITMFFDNRCGNFKEFVIRLNKNTFKDFFNLLKTEYENRNATNIAQQENRTSLSREDKKAKDIPNKEPNAKKDTKIIFKAFIDDKRKVLSIITPDGQEEIGFKKKKIKKEDKRFARNPELVDKIENDKSETKFFKAFATFFEMKKEVGKFQDKEILTNGQSVDNLAEILNTTTSGVRNYIARINKLISDKNLPIKLETDNRGNYQMIMLISKNITTK